MDVGMYGRNWEAWEQDTQPNTIWKSKVGIFFYLLNKQTKQANKLSDIDSLKPAHKREGMANMLSWKIEKLKYFVWVFRHLKVRGFKTLSLTRKVFPEDV